MGIAANHQPSRARTNSALQRRDLEKLNKKFQVARMELAKEQSLAKADLNCEGGFNPRKVGQDHAT